MQREWRVGTNPELQVNRSGADWAIRRPDFVGSYSPDSRCGAVRYAGELPFLSSFLRVLACAVLSRKRGALVHAATVRTAGGVLLFPGPSGTGKSTVAGLAPPGTVLSDEVSAVQIVEDRAVCFPSPFWGDLLRTRAAEGGPLRGVVLLERGSPTEVSRPSPAAVFATLVHCAFAFDSALCDKVKIVGVMAWLAQNAPLYLLRYEAPENPWPALERSLSRLEAEP